MSGKEHKRSTGINGEKVVACSCCLPAMMDACLHELLLCYSLLHQWFVLNCSTAGISWMKRREAAPAASILVSAGKWHTTAPVPKWKAGPRSFWGRKWRTIQAVISCSLSCGAAANNSKMIKNSFLNHVSALMNNSNCSTHQSPAQQANSPQTSDVLEDIKRC